MIGTFFTSHFGIRVSALYGTQSLISSVEPGTGAEEGLWDIFEDLSACKISTLLQFIASLTSPPEPNGVD